MIERRKSEQQMMTDEGLKRIERRRGLNPGIRPVRGKLVPDRNGMPSIQLNHDDLVRAAWEITMEKFFPRPKPEPRRHRALRWLRRLIRWQ